MNKDDKENIITHELIHLKQKHSIDLLIIEFLCIIQWFNPFVWMYKKAIKENHEFLADSKVINTGINLFSYQSLLIAQTVGLSGFVLTNSLNYSLTKKRLLMMTKKRSSKLNVLKSILLLCILIPLLGVYSFVPDKYSTNSFLKTSGFNDDSVYYIVDEMPEYPGGDEALQLYIATNIEYPEIAKKLGVTAQVFIAFIIDENGKVTDVSVVRSAAKDMEIEFGTQENPTKYDAALLLDKSAFDVISSLPDWKPGVKKGKKVKVHYQAPIKFNLN